MAVDIDTLSGALRAGRPWLAVQITLLRLTLIPLFVVGGALVWAVILVLGAIAWKIVRWAFA